MIELKPHCILENKKVSDALLQLNDLGNELTLFVIKEDQSLIGSITDGDIRRGLLNGIALDDSVVTVMYANFKFIRDEDYNQNELNSIRSAGIKLLPVLDHNNRIKKILNLSMLKGLLPVDVVIMAGGEGKRLRPLTEKKPKPLLPVGNKPIIEHNIDRLLCYGIEHFWISIGYLGEQIENYFGNGGNKGINVQYVREHAPLGTIGSIKLIQHFKSDHILVINSDILSTINFQEFYDKFVSAKADFAVATIPYQVNVPYAVLETNEGYITGFKEKPTYTYHSNAGIYLMRKEVFETIPEGFFNATDLMEALIRNGAKLVSYPLIEYWLDIGKHDDYIKANEDIKHLIL